MRRAAHVVAIAALAVVGTSDLIAGYGLRAVGAIVAHHLGASETSAAIFNFVLWSAF